MDSSANPWLLVQSHRYQSAIDIYRSRLSRGGADASTYAELGTAYLCVGDAALATEAYRRAEAAARLEIPAELGRSDAHLLWIATSLLVQHRDEEAVQELLSATEGIRRGQITRSDGAGGAMPGLMLYYAAGIAGNDGERSRARQYMTWLLRKQRSKNWPGPLMHLLLGANDPASVLRERFGSSRISEVSDLAKEDLGIRRAAATTLFYVYVALDAQGDATSAAEALAAAAALENPILSPEWYLANAQTLEG